MGVGSSNVSSSDLAVYQSSVTSISQDLQNNVSNVASIKLKGIQKININNGSALQEIPDYNRCGAASERATRCLNVCEYYAKQGAGISEYEICVEKCDAIADCIAFQPTINCDLTISNISNQTASTSQIADASVDAQMTTFVQNKFESEIDKTINQSNVDFNFSQFNNSNERTTLSQQIRNNISNAISEASANKTEAINEIEQVINFSNYGVINCSGCAKKDDTMTIPLGAIPPPVTILPSNFVSGGCGLTITNLNVQAANIDQKASAALSSIMNNDLLNDLTSKYKLQVAQLNKGVNPAEVLGMIMGIILAIAVVIIAMGYSFAVSMKPLIYAAFALGAALGIIFLITWAACALPDIDFQINKECQTTSQKIAELPGKVISAVVTVPGTGYIANRIVEVCTFDAYHTCASQLTDSPTTSPTTSPATSPTTSPDACLGDDCPVLDSVATTTSNSLNIYIKTVDERGGITSFDVMSGSGDSTYKVKDILNVVGGLNGNGGAQITVTKVNIKI